VNLKKYLYWSQFRKRNIEQRRLFSDILFDVLFISIYVYMYMCVYIYIYVCIYVYVYI